MLRLLIIRIFRGSLRQMDRALLDWGFVFDFLCFQHFENHFEVDHADYAICIYDFLFVDLEVRLVLIVVVLEVLHGDVHLTDHDLVLSQFIHVPDDENQAFRPQQIDRVDWGVNLWDQPLLPRHLLDLLFVGIPHSIRAFTGAGKVVDEV